MNIPLVDNGIFLNHLSPQKLSLQSNDNCLSPKYNKNILRNQSQIIVSSKDSSLKFSNNANSNTQENITNNNNQTSTENFKVFIRWRPLDPRERNMINNKKKAHILKKQDNMIFVLDPDRSQYDSSSKKEKWYVFDDIFDENFTTISLYNQQIQPIIQNVFNGYNSTIFAYGMTGAGKSYTMFGNIAHVNHATDAEPGIIALTLNDIFKGFLSPNNEEFRFLVKLSYLEIYNEQTRDLLNKAGDNLMIIEDPIKGVIVPNLTEFTINSIHEAIELIRQGNSRRVMASTHVNQFSSRSHAIMQILVEKHSRVKDVIEAYTQSKLSLVDLAGSERAATSENRGLRQQEGANINRSLLALGNCIKILSDNGKKGAFVPYRDSKLTRLLKDSLGGNTRTIMIACISPSFLCYEETINTLKYANRAKNIKRTIIKNVKEVEMHVSEYKNVIESLKHELTILKKQLEEQKSLNSLKVKSDDIKPEMATGSGGYGSTGGILDTKPKSACLDMITEHENHSMKRSLPFGHMSGSSVNGNSQQINEKTNDNIDQISIELFSILEEGWEISQTLNELTDLRMQNEKDLKEKIRLLEDSRNQLDKERLTEEIEQLKEVMSNNDKIYNEMQQNLHKNQIQKHRIQEKLKEVSSAMTYDTQILIETCKVLSMEKKELLTQNQEIMQTAKNLAKEKELKDDKINLLEKQMQLIKEKLAEKDLVIAQNQQIIKCLAHSKKSSNEYVYPEILKNLPNARKESFEQMKNSITSKEKNGAGESVNSYRYSPGQKKEKSSMITMTPNTQSQQLRPNPSKIMTMNDTENNLHANGSVNKHQYESNSKCIINNEGINPNQQQAKPNNGHRLDNRKFSVPNIKPISIQDLKNYAEKLKGINFDNLVNLKRRKHKRTKLDKDNYIKNNAQGQNTNSQQLEKNPSIVLDNQSQITSNLDQQILEKSANIHNSIHKCDNTNNNINTRITKVPKPNQPNNFVEISSIINDPQNGDVSLEVCIKDMKVIFLNNTPKKSQKHIINNYDKASSVDKDIIIKCQAKSQGDVNQITDNNNQDKGIIINKPQENLIVPLSSSKKSKKKIFHLNLQTLTPALPKANGIKNQESNMDKDLPSCTGKDQHSNVDNNQAKASITSEPKNPDYSNDKYEKLISADNDENFHKFGSNSDIMNIPNQFLEVDNRSIQMGIAAQSLYSRLNTITNSDNKGILETQISSPINHQQQSNTIKSIYSKDNNSNPVSLTGNHPLQPIVSQLYNNRNINKALGSQHSSNKNINDNNDSNGKDENDNDNEEGNKLGIEIKCLENERERIKSLKSKLTNLVYILDNGLLNDHDINDIIKLIKEINAKKYMLNPNDLIAFKKLENVLIYDTNQKENIHNSCSDKKSNPHQQYQDSHYHHSKKESPLIFSERQLSKNGSRLETPRKYISVNEMKSTTASEKKVDDCKRSLMRDDMRTRFLIKNNLQRTKREHINSLSIDKGKLERQYSDYFKYSQYNSITDVASSRIKTISNEISDYNTTKSKQKIAVQDLISKQKKHLQQEMEKLTKQQSIDKLGLNTISQL